METNFQPNTFFKKKKLVFMKHLQNVEGYKRNSVHYLREDQMKRTIFGPSVH